MTEKNLKEYVGKEFIWTSDPKSKVKSELKGQKGVVVTVNHNRIGFIDNVYPLVVRILTGKLANTTTNVTLNNKTFVNRNKANTE